MSEGEVGPVAADSCLGVKKSLVLGETIHRNVWLCSSHVLL